MNEYLPRISDSLIERKLQSLGAVVIVGPKWCGKTTSAKIKANSVLSLSSTLEVKRARIILENNPSKILSSPTPLLIDEWQTIPEIWDEVRTKVDERNAVGQFILTGSAVPPNLNSLTLHSGTGRFGWIKMRPMSLYESKDSSGEISLQDLFLGKEQIYGENNIDIDKLCYLICRGGWPHSLFVDEQSSLDIPFDYIEGVISSDVSRVDGINRKPDRVRSLLRSYARNQGNQANLEVLKQEMENNDSKSLEAETLSSYLNALRQIFVIEDVQAWNPNLRSKCAIRTSDTRYFIDPSIASASLGIGPNDLINDINTLGFFLETLCIRDLRVYAESLNGNIYHYRDNKGLECDAVIHLRNGSYGLIEIKLGGETLIEEGSKNLLKLSKNIDTTKMKKPSFLMILTGLGSIAYRRKDGVFVVPIGCLKN